MSRDVDNPERRSPTPGAAGWLLVLCLSLHVALTAPLLVQDSLTADEPVHMAAAYLAAADCDLRLNQEHPPLAKVLAGLGLLAGGFSFPYDSPGYAAADQYAVARQFVYGDRNDPAAMTLCARLPLYLLSLAFLVFLWVFCQRLWGNRIALLAVFLFAFCPLALAHGHLVATDAPLAAFGFAGVALSALALERGSYRLAVAGGVLLGLALLAKFTGLLALAFVGGLGLAAVLFGRGTRRQAAALSTCTLAMALSTLLWGCWLFGARTPGGQGPLWHYLEGLAMVREHVTRGHWRPQFLLGSCSFEGWWGYFPVALVLKTSVFMQALLLLSAVQALRRSGQRNGWEPDDRRRETPERPNRQEAVPGEAHASRTEPEAVLPADEPRPVRARLLHHALWGFPVFYLLASLPGNLNIGARHLLPILPFLCVFMAVQLEAFLADTSRARTAGRNCPEKRPDAVDPAPEGENGAGLPRSRFGPRSGPGRGRIAVAALLAACLGSTLLAWPGYMGFFTEWARGHPERLLNDSNLDWGQDLLRLRQYLDREGIARIRLDYFGPAGAAESCLGERYRPWSVDLGLPTDGWFGVSEFYVMTSRCYQRLGTSRTSYACLDNLEPTARIGTSIRVYRLGGPPIPGQTGDAGQGGGKQRAGQSGAGGMAR